MGEIIQEESIIDCRSYFAGRWDLVRSFSDGSLFKGFVVFDPVARLRAYYREEGYTTNGVGGESKAWCDYYFVFAQRGFTVYFDQRMERLFHRIVFEWHAGEVRGDARHDCRNDVYLSTYTIESKNVFRVVHRVTGPLKNYVSKARFQRLT